MKNRFLFALPLAASLMVPAVAQTSSTPSDTQQQQPAATSTQGTQSSSSQDMQSTPNSQANKTDDLGARQPLQPETKQGFWGKINPFARKKYVARQLEPIRNRVNELDELTSSNTKMLKDVDSRAQEGIRIASAKATEADQHAVDAGNRAQMANQSAQQASTRLQTVEQVVGNIDQYQPATQTEIRFRSGQTALSEKAKDALDQMAGNLKDQKGYIIEVQGFSPGKGQAALSTSQNMADSVVRYLVLNHDIPVYRIFVLGMGNVPQQTAEGKSTRLRAGRVDVALLKNNLEQLSSTQSAGGSQSAPASTQGGVTGAAQPDSSQPQSAAPNSSIAAPAQQQPPASQQPSQQTPPPASDQSPK